MERYLVGVDIGSGGCKVSVIDLKTKRVETRSREYPTYYPRPGWAEQKPEDWVSAASFLTKSILAKKSTIASEIIAIGLSGVTHSPVILDKNGSPISRSIHLTDIRSQKEANYLKERLGEEILKATMNDVNVMWTAPMLLWIKNHKPEVWNKIRHVIFPKDYVRYRLTGEIATDHIDAEGSLLYNTHSRSWDERFLSILGLKPNQLPLILNPTDISGKVTTEGYRIFGFKEGTPVITGSTDTLLEVFASGCRNPGDCTVKLATFGRICVISDKPIFDEKLITYSYIYPGMFYPGTGTKSFASSLRWFRDRFFKSRSQIEKGNPSIEPQNNEIDLSSKAYNLMEKEAENVPPGSEGLIFHPYLQGEGSPYNDPKLRGGFFGITLRHGPPHFIRAILEGTSFSILDSMNFIREKNLTVREPIRLIGGGTKNRLWTEILIDVLGMEGIIPPAMDPSSGAALLAGVGTGVFSSLEEAQGFFSENQESINFKPEKHTLYKRLFNLYKIAHDKMLEVYHGLADFGSG